MEELLALKWNNHQSTFLRIIRGLRSKLKSDNQNSHADVTLACDGAFYPVHKFVLSTCSDYFNEIFCHTNCTNPVIVLKDITCKNLEYLLDYMYIGEINVKQNELAALVSVAECLKIKGLAVPDESNETAPKPSTKSGSFQKKTHSVPRERQSEELPLRNEMCIKTENSIDIMDEDTLNYHLSSSETLQSKNVKLEPVDSQMDMSQPVEINTLLGVADMTASEIESSLEEFHVFGQNQIKQNGLEGISSSSGAQMDSFALGWSDAPLGISHSSAVASSSFSSHAMGSSSKSFIFSKRLKRRLSNLKATKSGFSRNSKINYVCPHCSYSCYDHSNFKRHVQIHTGEKPYHCPFCNYSTIHSSNLKTHIRNRHSSDVINKSFNFSIAGKQTPSNQGTIPTLTPTANPAMESLIN